MTKVLYMLNDKHNFQRDRQQKSQPNHKIPLQNWERYLPTLQQPLFPRILALISTWPRLQLKYVSLKPTHSLGIEGLFSPAHSLNERFSTLMQSDSLRHFTNSIARPLQDFDIFVLFPPFLLSKISGLTTHTETHKKTKRKREVK